MLKTRLDIVMRDGGVGWDVMWKRELTCLLHPVQSWVRTQLLIQPDTGTPHLRALLSPISGDLNLGKRS